VEEACTLHTAPSSKGARPAAASTPLGPRTRLQFAERPTPSRPKPWSASKSSPVVENAPVGLPPPCSADGVPVPSPPSCCGPGGFRWEFQLHSGAAAECTENFPSEPPALLAAACVCLFATRHRKRRLAVLHSILMPILTAIAAPASLIFPKSTPLASVIAAFSNPSYTRSVGADPATPMWLESRHHPGQN
jgi:hypothetical protein